MITLEEFRLRCAAEKAEDVVDEVLLADEAKHVSVENRTFILEGLSRKFGVDPTDIHLWIVGSAKLGFSIIEKRTPGGELLPRYRSFSALSDVDIAVVSPRLFMIIWDELCIYAHDQPWIPWNSHLLGDYLVYGWLRLLG